MCLIAYVPSGAEIPRYVFNYAAEQNPDGFGIMSTRGVEKFLGKRARRKALRLSRELSAAGVAHAVHWRWATHGDVTKELCHPFTTPNGAAHVMHNGVLAQTKAYATKHASDTLLYVEQLTDAPAAVQPGADSPYWGQIAADITNANRMVVLYPESGTFYLLQEDAGIWIEGIWYSNTYSLPSSFTGLPEYTFNDEPTSLADWLKSEDAKKSTRPGDSGYAIGKRYNVVTGRWDYPEERKRGDNAEDEALLDWLAQREAGDAAMAREVTVPGDGRPLYAGGPTFEDIADTGGYARRWH